MEHFVTLFDSAFIPQGLALHASLERHAKPYTLWILCMDKRSEEILASLSPPNVHLVALADIETPRLLAVKPERSRAEYCWTLTPFTPAMVFERSDATRVTYIDADLYFLKSPAPLFQEFEASGKAVMLTEHAYDAEYDLSATSGIYCVQFMSFQRGTSAPAMTWWQDRCVDWCYARFEDGKFGDQKYLDDWPTRFPELVHVLKQRDALLAPWNARRFPYSSAIAWHFHGLRILKGESVLLYSNYRIPKISQQQVYGPYLHDLRRAIRLSGVQIAQTKVRRRPFLTLSLLKHFLKAWRNHAHELYERDVIRPLPTDDSNQSL